jgi:hypothetical protein
LFGKLLRSVMLSREGLYKGIDPSLYDERRRARLEKHAVEQLEALGFNVSLTQRTPAARPTFSDERPRVLPPA